MPRQSRRAALALLGDAGLNVARAGDLIAVSQIVDRMEDRIVVRDIDDGAVGKHAVHAFHEDLPLVFAPEIVAHEEAAAQKISRICLRLCVGETPLAHLHGVEPGPVVDIVAVVQIHGLLDGAHVDAGEAAHGFREMAVGARIILRPHGIAFAPVPAARRKPKPPPKLRPACGYMRRANAHSVFSR